jgi:hypothetical protein
MDLKPVFEKLYPTGHLGGECGVFAHLLVEFLPVGNSYAEKKRAVDKHGTRGTDGIRAGDVIITSEGTFLGFGYGHVAVVNFANDTNLWLTESNFKKDKKVTHNRMIARSSGKIYGYLRGKPNYTLPMEFPLQPKLTIMMNFPKQWGSHDEVQKVFDWFFTASGGKIDFTAKSGLVYTSFKDWEVEYMASGGSTFSPAIKEAWIKEYVRPLMLPDTDCLALVLPTASWNMEIFGMPGYVEAGACYGDKPVTVLVAADDNLPSRNFPKYSSMFDFLRHELCHYLYKIGNGSGFDFTHNHYQDDRMEDIFAPGNLDYELINQKLFDN